jgi:iron-sulfur cluster insertion protein
MYKFKIEKNAEEEDFKFTQDGICLLVDPLSYQYLDGATVDYETDVFTSRFVVNNPNSKGQCGCGESFSI